MRISDYNRYRPGAALRRPGVSVARHFIVSTFVLLTASACTRLSPVEWSEFASVDPAGWSPMMSAEFTPLPPDSVYPWPGVYDVVVCLRYKADAPQSVLTLTISEECDTSDVPSTRMQEIYLFNELHKPMGRGSYAVYEVTDTLHRRFSPPPGYTVTCSLPEGSPSPRGVIDIGLLLRRSGEKSVIPIPHIKL
ncbi:MAG: gliding motility lipoprotein GldH [Muribaculaceae bacterium]|nr:gliding motility lipoprotein GldH [Muribaculaceae bacterium]